MHDLDIDKELADLIATVRSRSNDTQHGMLTAAIERVMDDPTRLDDPVPGTDLVPYEPAGEVATLTESGVPDSASSAIFHFDAVVELELGKIVSARRKHEEMRKEKPLTFQTPEYKVEVENASIDSVLVLADAVEALERAVR